MRILMATGGSRYSEAALRFASQIAKYAGEPPTVLTVIKREMDRFEAEATLSRAREILLPAVPEIRTRIRVGHPAEEIVSEAEDGRYDVVIVGERQNYGLRARFLLGSTAERVVEHAPCPVIIAKGQVRPIRRILLCDSGAQNSSLLSRFTAQLAKLIGGEEEITILHVMSQMGAGPGVSGEQLGATAEQLIAEQTPEGEILEQDVQMLDQPDIHPTPKVRHGLVVDEILDEARAGDYDLVVIGAHRGEGWRRILLDDLAHQIVTQLDRPVLIVR